MESHEWTVLNRMAFIKNTIFFLGLIKVDLFYLVHPLMYIVLLGYLVM
jgi:hypothetical protein